MIKVYGIPNCDSVKKARVWLQQAGLTYAFHDFKKDGVPVALLRDWMTQLGWERVLNRRGPTWRKLDPAAQAAVVDAASATDCALTHSSVIKRPVIVWSSGTVTIGYTPDTWPA